MTWKVIGLIVVLFICVVGSAHLIKLVLPPDRYCVKHDDRYNPYVVDNPEWIEWAIEHDK